MIVSRLRGFGGDEAESSGTDWGALFGAIIPAVVTAGASITGSVTGLIAAQRNADVQMANGQVQLGISDNQLLASNNAYNTQMGVTQVNAQTQMAIAAQQAESQKQMLYVGGGVGVLLVLALLIGSRR
jgi:hypothetical protein